jgi:catechol 2,3-dioxygenase-like lactoylglutathione lyase family enzyme
VSERRVIRTRGLTHVALKVCDVDRALRFYAEVFGAVEVFRSMGFVQAQTPGSFDVLVFEEGLHRPAATGDIAHFGFRLLIQRRTCQNAPARCGRTP